MSIPGTIKGSLMHEHVLFSLQAFQCPCQYIVHNPRNTVLREDCSGKERIPVAARLQSNFSSKINKKNSLLPIEIRLGLPYGRFIGKHKM